MAGAYPGFCSMDGMVVHCRVTPNSMSPVPILYTWVERDNVGKVSCLWKQYSSRDLQM